MVSIIIICSHQVHSRGRGFLLLARRNWAGLGNVQGQRRVLLYGGSGILVVVVFRQQESTMAWPVIY